MRIVVFATLLTCIVADVSHLTSNSQIKTPLTSYGFPAAPSNSYGFPPFPTASYGVPQGPIQSLSDFNQNYFGRQSFFGSPSTKFGLPNADQNVNFLSGFSTTPSPFSGFGYSSTSAPNVEINGVSSTPSPIAGFGGFSSSTPAPSGDFAGFSSTTPAPSVDFAGYSSTTPSPVDFGSSNLGINFAGATGSFGPISSSQFAADAALNSGSSASLVTGLTSGGSLKDSFGIHTSVGGEATDVQKHLYFFAAPEEPEEIQSRINVPVAPPKKNVKIIFIKAPSYGVSSKVHVPAPPQNEEKTLVYVLVKKPEAVSSVDVQPPAPTVPSKPEVFFIKYKTKQEAEEAISKVQADHAAAGEQASRLIGPQTLLSQDTNVPTHVVDSFQHKTFESTPSPFLVSSTTPSPFLGFDGFSSFGLNNAAPSFGFPGVSSRLGSDVISSGYPFGGSSTTASPLGFGSFYSNLGFGGLPGASGGAVLASREGEASLPSGSTETTIDTSSVTPETSTASSTTPVLDVGVVENSSVGNLEVNKTETVQSGPDVAQNLVVDDRPFPGSFGASAVSLGGAEASLSSFNSGAAPSASFSSNVAPLSGFGGSLSSLEGFSSTASPYAGFSSSSEPLFKSFEASSTGSPLLGLGSGVYQSSTTAPVPFKTYGAPSFKK